MRTLLMLVLAVVIASEHARASELHVPEQYPTIQSALLASGSGDTVVVAAGVWAEPELSLPAGVSLRGSTGDPADVVIDAAAGTYSIACEASPADTVSISHVTCRGGDTGILLRNVLTARLTGCVITETATAGLACDSLFAVSLIACRVTGNGGPGVQCSAAPGVASSLLATDCVIADNDSAGVHALGDVAVTFDGSTLRGNGGGGVRMDAGQFVASQVTIAYNRGPEAIHVSGAATVSLSETLVAWNHGRALASTAIASLNCSNLFGNAGGDWIDNLAALPGSDGNFSANPLVCDAVPAPGHLTVAENSPCLPGHHPLGTACGPVGALSAACPARDPIVSPDSLAGDYPTIQAAVDAVAAGSTILLADGVFTGAGNRDVVFGGKNLVLRSQSGDRTSCVIDCEGSAAQPRRGLLFTGGEDSTTVVKALTIRGGFAAGDGGCVLMTAVPGVSYGPRLEDCVIESGTATGRGGGLYLGVSTSDIVYMPALRSTVVRDCHADLEGGGLGLGRGVSPQIAGCDLLDNTSDWGGALAFHSLSQAVITTCRFERNSASSAGGAVNGGFENYATFTDCLFRANEGGTGGAVFVGPSVLAKARPGEEGAALGYDSFLACSFVANTADLGGAAFVAAAGWPTFTACAFDSNSAVSGGALYCESGLYGQVADCVFRHNSAQQGGACYAGPYYGPVEGALQLWRCTLVGNEAASGAGLWCDAAQHYPRVELCILAFNGPGEAVRVPGPGSFHMACNDIYGNAGGDWIGDLAPLSGTDGNIARNPLFCPGTTGAPSLAENSPCLAGQHPDSSACGTMGAPSGVCGSIAFTPARVRLSAENGTRHHPGDVVTLSASLEDSAGSVVPDDGVPPAWAASPALGTLSPLALQADGRWRAAYVAGGTTGSDTLIVQDPDCAAASRDTFVLQVTAAAIITSVRDIPDDQGRQVRVSWRADAHDSVGSATPVTCYYVWRRVDGPLKTGSAILAPDELGSALAGSGGNDGSDTLLQLGSQLWEPAGYPVPGVMWPSYSLVAPTLVDSTATDGVQFSVFRVSAHTQDPQIFFFSDPDSGWSVDNIPPNAPQGFTLAYGGLGNSLAWLASQDPDWRSFRVYRSEAGNMPLEQPVLVHETTTTTWLDDGTEAPWDGNSPWAYVYSLTSVDVSGNESDAVVPLSPPTGTDAPDFSPRWRLWAATPNPFNPATILSFEVPGDAGRVTLRIYDVRGRHVCTLIDGPLPPGPASVAWRGRDSQDRAVPAGVYFGRLHGAGFTGTVRLALVR